MKKIFLIFFCLFFFTNITNASELSNKHNDLVDRSKKYIFDFNNNIFETITEDAYNESGIQLDKKQIEERWNSLTSIAGSFNNIYNINVHEDKNYILVSIVSKHSEYYLASIFTYTNDNKLAGVDLEIVTIYDKEKMLGLALRHKNLLINEQFEALYFDFSEEFKKNLPIDIFISSYTNTINSFGKFIGTRKITYDIFEGFAYISVINEYSNSYLSLNFIYNQNNKIVAFSISLPSPQVLESLNSK